jgi:hypothetical protein
MAGQSNAASQAGKSDSAQERTERELEEKAKWGGAYSGKQGQKVTNVSRI